MTDQNKNEISLGKTESIKFYFDEKVFREIRRGQQFVVLEPLTHTKRFSILSAELKADKSCIKNYHRAQREVSILSKIRIVEASLECNLL